MPKDIKDIMDDINKYMFYEEQRQTIANSPNFDKKTFLSLYGPDVMELYPSSKIHPKFYDRKIENVSPYAKFRSDAVMTAIPNSPRNILDVGCGLEMNMLKRIQAKYPNNQLFGLDMAGEDSGQIIDGIKLIKGSITDHECKLTPEYYDIIICMEMMEHISPRHTMQVWQKMKKALHPKGTLLITIPYTPEMKNHAVVCPICNYWVVSSGHVRAYPPSVVKAELAVNGFKLIQSKSFNEIVMFYEATKA